MAITNVHEAIRSIFALAHTVCKILIFKLDLENLNLGQGRVVEKLDLRHSVANINLHERYREHFYASSYSL